MKIDRYRGRCVAGDCKGWLDELVRDYPSTDFVKCNVCKVSFLRHWTHKGGRPNLSDNEANFYQQLGQNNISLEQCVEIHHVFQNELKGELEYFERGKPRDYYFAIQD